MPRGKRAGLAAQPAPPPVTSDAESPPPPRRQPKKRTVAENAMAIDTIHSKIETMSSLLTQVVGQLQRPDSAVDHVAPDTEIDQASACRYPQVPLLSRTRHRSDLPNTDFIHHSRSRHYSVSSSSALPEGNPRPHSTRRRPPYEKVRPLDPLAARSTHPPRRDAPTTLHDLNESADLQERVAHLISATLAPPHLSGKKAFAHSYVRRGAKKSRTSLADLSLSEYNVGFIRLMNSREVDPEDRPFMFQHLENVNEDAITYPFTDVRAWSEEVCFLIAESELTWDDHYRIDLLRLKLSQNGPAGREQKNLRDPARRSPDVGALDPLTDFSPEVRAARPAAPCRLFNTTGCSQKTHHVTNGFRQLYVCSSCVYHKCSLLPHSERECKSKDFRRKQPAKDPEPGFGK